MNKIVKSNDFEVVVRVAKQEKWSFSSLKYDVYEQPPTFSYPVTIREGGGQTWMKWGTLGMDITKVTFTGSNSQYIDEGGYHKTAVINISKAQNSKIAAATFFHLLLDHSLDNGTQHNELAARNVLGLEGPSSQTHHSEKDFTRKEESVTESTLKK